jgi:hypothetical protein
MLLGTVSVTDEAVGLPSADVICTSWAKEAKVRLPWASRVGWFVDPNATVRV